MRILFLMSHAGATRNFESTLRGLADRGHEVHLGFDRMEKKNLPGLWDLANALTAAYPGITAGQAPAPLGAESSWLASRMRASLDYLRFLNEEYDDAPKLRRRAEQWAPERVRKLGPHRPTRSALRFTLKRGDQASAISESVRNYLEQVAPDVVLVTPLLEPGSAQVEFLRGARRSGIPTALCVHSWDNLTNKGLIHEIPDAVTVWNEMQRDELVRYHRVPAERVVITGAASYDHWFGWRPSRSREEFAAAVGLDPERPFAAYLGSSGFIAPNEAEFVVEWMHELRGQGLGDMQVLVRPHPVNPMLEDGQSIPELAELENLKLYPPAGANPTDIERRKDYFDSLYYASAATGVNTSAFLEAAIVGRPVLTVLAPRHEETQKGMLHFHHLLEAGGGLLQVASTFREHAEHLRAALASPHPDGCVSDRSRRFTEAFIRPHGLDDPATPRLVHAIEELRGRHVSAGDCGGVSGAIFARAARTGLEWRRRSKLRRDRRKKNASIKAKAQAAKRKEISAAAKAKAAEVKAAKAKAAEEKRDAKNRAAREKHAAKERAARAERQAKAAIGEAENGVAASAEVTDSGSPRGPTVRSHELEGSARTRSDSTRPRD